MGGGGGAGGISPSENEVHWNDFRFQWKSSDPGFMDHWGRKCSHQKQDSIAHRFSLSSSHPPDLTEQLLKRTKKSCHPAIHPYKGDNSTHFSQCLIKTLANSVDGWVTFDFTAFSAVFQLFSRTPMARTPLEP